MFFLIQSLMFSREMAKPKGRASISKKLFFDSLQGGEKNKF